MHVWSLRHRPRRLPHRAGLHPGLAGASAARRSRHLQLTEGLGENRGLGWHLRIDSSPATQMLSPGSFGHFGFTGTSVWFDKQREQLMVLLTNRVHPCAAQIGMGGGCGGSFTGWC